MHRGYVPVWRKLKDSTIYRDSEAVHLWLHILFEAQHSEKKEWFKGEEVVLQEGQFTTGRKRLASETGISESKIQRLLNKFVKCHMIEQQTNSANRLISIVNYRLHQVSEQQSNSNRTASEQLVNNVRTHSNNYNNYNNDNIGESEKPKEKPRKQFKKPTVEEVIAYCQERKNNVDAQKFIDHYTSNGWKVGKNSMKDWKAAVRNWERTENSSQDLFKRAQPAGVTLQAEQQDAARYQSNQIEGEW